MSDFKLTGSDFFGRYCRIEQFRYGKPNEMHIYKVVSSIRTNTWCEVPYKEASKEVWHGRMEDCILAIHCGIDETKVHRFRIADVEFMPRKECYREALLKLANEMDRDAHIQREREKAGNSHYLDGLDVMEYASRIRHAVNDCQGGSDATVAGDKAEAADSRYDDCDDVEGHHIIDVSDKFNENIAAIDWVREQGGLDAVKARLMPEGMEWPRYEDGEQVRIGNEVHIENEKPYPNFDMLLESITISSSGFSLTGADNEYVEFRAGERVKRTKKKATDSDRVECVSVRGLMCCKFERRNDDNDSD